MQLYNFIAKSMPTQSRTLNVLTLSSRTKFFKNWFFLSKFIDYSTTVFKNASSINYCNTNVSLWQSIRHNEHPELKCLWWVDDAIHFSIIVIIIITAQLPTYLHIIIISKTRPILVIYYYNYCHHVCVLFYFLLYSHFLPMLCG